MDFDPPDPPPRLPRFAIQNSTSLKRYPPKSSRFSPSLKYEPESIDLTNNQTYSFHIAKFVKKAQF